VEFLAGSGHTLRLCFHLTLPPALLKRDISRRNENIQAEAKKLPVMRAVEYHNGFNKSNSAHILPSSLSCMYI
jgi:hypothetical protein